MMHLNSKHVRMWTMILIVTLSLINLGQAPTRSAHASPTGGAFVVNSSADTNTPDNALTLREALLIARGGTGASGLNRTLSDGERAQVFSAGGCTFSGSSNTWTITGGCGLNVADTITFSAIPLGDTITLASALPLIDDTQPTQIYGGIIAPTIDANYLTNYGLRVTSNGNRLDSIGVRRASIGDFYIEGDSNILYNVWAWESGNQGVIIAGNNDTIDGGSRLGVNNISNAACNSNFDRGNTYNGVYIMSTATYATVQNSYLGCNGMGVYIVSSATAGHHTIGPDNRIGVNSSNGGDLGNLNSGIYVGMNNNVVMSNTISHNNRYGLEITGDFNYVGGNNIHANTEAGVALRAWASNNTIGKLSLFGGIVSNTITSNIGHGILITDVATPPGSTLILGNYIGVNVNGTAYGNGGNGILVYGGHDTYIGGSGAQRNIIGSNALAGVNIDGGAYNSHIAGNLIGINASVFSRPNGSDGVVIQGGAHDNDIGAASVGNTIMHNAGNGVLLKDALTASNIVTSNVILTNTLAGVAIRTGANSNYVQANTIRLNGNAGVLIDGGAHDNRIGEFGSRALGNVISANATDGIYIGGATTRYNAVVGNNIGTNASGNAADPNLHTGVTLDAGTYGNAIGEYTTERNVIAGNSWDGVLLINGVHDNAVRSNDIGVNRDYAPVMSQQPDRPTGGGGTYLAIPNGGGVSIVGSYTNTIGGYIAATDAANFISYNTHTGVYLSNAAHHNIVGSNYVNYNGDYGILLDGGNTAYNTITRTLIYFNGLDGIGERNSAGFNVWTEVGINDNGGLGIDKNIPNSPGTGDLGNIINAPYVFFDSINKATGVVQGRADASILGTVKVELYRVKPDASGYGEGAIFIGSDVTDGSGNWAITDTSAPSVRGCYVALVTEAQLVIPFNSSEFSANTCRVMLPVAVR